MSTRSDAEIIDIVIRLLFLALFLYLALKLVAPLFSLMLWAVILAVAVYPAYRWLADRLGGRETLAAALVTLLGLAITLGPVAMLTTGVIDNATKLVVQIQTGKLALPSADHIRDIRLVGHGWPIPGRLSTTIWARWSPRSGRRCCRREPSSCDASPALVWGC